MSLKHECLNPEAPPIIFGYGSINSLPQLRALPIPNLSPGFEITQINAPFRFPLQPLETSLPIFDSKQPNSQIWQWLHQCQKYGTHCLYRNIQAILSHSPTRREAKKLVDSLIKSPKSLYLPFPALFLYNTEQCQKGLPALEILIFAWNGSPDYDQSCRKRGFCRQGKNIGGAPTSFRPRSSLCPSGCAERAAIYTAKLLGLNLGSHTSLESSDAFCEQCTNVIIANKIAVFAWRQDHRPRIHQPENLDPDDKQAIMSIRTHCTPIQRGEYPSLPQATVWLRR